MTQANIFVLGDESHGLQFQMFIILHKTSVFSEELLLRESHITHTVIEMKNQVGQIGPTK